MCLSTHGSQQKQQLHKGWGGWGWGSVGWGCVRCTLCILQGWGCKAQIHYFMFPNVCFVPLSHHPRLRSAATLWSQSCPVALSCPYWKGGPETPWAFPVRACMWVHAHARTHTYVLVFSCQLPFTYDQNLNKERLENRWKSQNYLQATREIF